MTDTVNRSEHTILFERVFEAPPEAVFDAWTKPEEIAEWWDPTGIPLALCTLDLKPKGAFRFVTKGHAPPFEGTYLTIERPKRLEFEAMGAIGIVTFESKDGTTTMNVAIRCASEEHFEMFLKLGVNEGTSVTLDNLVRYLGIRPR